MSKQLFEQQTEWDLHEQTDFVPLEFTEEIKPDLFGLELQKAQEMTIGLSVTLAEREVLKNAYVDVIELEINAENLPIFKELRLKIVKNRTQGIEKWHKNNKAFYLAGGRFVDAVKNKEVLENVQMEEKLMEAEKFFENEEKERLRVLNESRIERIKPYLENAEQMDFTPMSEYDFDDFVLGKKTRFEQKIEEEKYEALRIENERIEREKAIEAQRIENERLKRETQEKEAQLQKERAESEAKQKAIQEEASKKAREEKAKHDAILEAEKQKNAKNEAELQAKKDAELKAEKERLAKIEKAKKLAKAPIKKQIDVWIDAFEIPNIEVHNLVTQSITSKFQDFKIWAKKQNL